MKKKASVATRLRKARKYIKYLEQGHTDYVNELNAYAEALLATAGGVDEACRALDVAEEETKADGWMGATSARWRIATTRAYYAPNPMRSGFITGLKMPDGYLDYDNTKPLTYTDFVKV